MDRRSGSSFPRCPDRGRRPRSIQSDLATFDDHIARRFHVNLSTAFDRNILALDHDRAIFLHGDTGIAAYDRDFVARSDVKLLADISRLVVTDLSREILAHGRTLVLADVGGAVTADLRRSV